MKTIALLLFSFLLSNSICAQYKFEKNGVTIRTTPQEVKDKNSSEFGWVYEMAQIHNMSNVTKTITFHVDMFYDGICSNCSNKEYQYTFKLAPGELLKGNILDRTSSGLKYFKEDKNKRIAAVLSDIQLTSFTVD